MKRLQSEGKEMLNQFQLALFSSARQNFFASLLATSFPLFFTPAAQAAQADNAPCLIAGIAFENESEAQKKSETPAKVDGHQIDFDAVKSGRADLNDLLKAASQNGVAPQGPVVRSFSGNASWYGIPFHGHLTASGQIFDMNKLSAANLSLRLPSTALVENPRNGKAVILVVNDRGPYVKTRVMDLSREAARQLGTLSHGVAYVDITAIERKRKTHKKSLQSHESESKQKAEFESR